MDPNAADRLRSILKSYPDDDSPRFGADDVREVLDHLEAATANFPVFYVDLNDDVVVHLSREGMKQRIRSNAEDRELLMSRNPGYTREDAALIFPEPQGRVWKDELWSVLQQLGGRSTSGVKLAERIEIVNPRMESGEEVDDGGE